MKRVLQNISRNKRVVSVVSLCFRGDRGPQRGQRTVEGTEGRRGDRGLWKGQRAVEETEGHREDRGPQRGQMVIEGKRAV